MKQLLFPALALLFLISMTQAIGQNTPVVNYRVLKTNGFQVKNQTRKQTLYRDSEFSSSDILNFPTKDTKLAVVQIGSFGETFEMVPLADNLKRYKLNPSNSLLASRPGKLATYVNFIAFLRDRKMLILDGKSLIEVVGTKFPMDEDHFFYIQYDWTGDKNEPVNKRLPIEGNSFVISKNELLKVDGQSITADQASNYRLFYYNAKTEESLFLQKFDLVFPDDQQLIQEVRTIIEGSSNTDMDALINGVAKYLNTHYGEPSIWDLQRWLRKHFGK